MAIKYFPFAPGIPWKLRAGSFLIPKVNGGILSKNINNKEIVVAAFGGLIESFLSISILETYNYLMPGSKKYWAGNDQFKILVGHNGIANGFFDDLTEETLKKFPVPLFFDKENRAYFNCLNNYINIKSINGNKSHKDRRPIFEQIAEKSLIPWENKFLPKIRASRISPTSLEKKFKMASFNIKNPFVMIFPNDEKISMHDVSCLNWTMIELKAFCALLNSKGIHPIIFSKIEKGYYINNTIILPIDYKYIFHMLPLAKAVLAKNIDFLFLANILSNGTIISEPHKDELNLFQNNEFINRKNKVIMKYNITPLEAVKLI